MSDPTTQPETRVIEHATCLACGCLCDDIRVVVEGGRIVEVENACSIGRPWFLAPRPGEGLPMSSIDGRPADRDEAIARAAEILGGARSPVVWGLSGSTVEGVASALAIADRIGAVVDLAGSTEGASRLSAFQRVGQVSASLGEVKDRADLVIFWGVDPLATHPRHWERYSVEPRGRFVPEGRAGRFVIVVNAGPSETSRAADLFVPVASDRQVEALEVLRALVRGVAIDPDCATHSAGLPFPTLEGLAALMKAAHYGAVFFGPGLGGSRASEALLRLVRDLNEGRRFVGLELGGPGNHPGASSVLAWQAGAPSAVDFGLGHPRHLPREATLVDRLKSGEVDAVLIVANDPAGELPPDALAQLTGIPSILIAPGATAPGRSASVAFDVARPGLEVGGTVARVDGVMLPLRSAIDSGLPSDRDVLNEIRVHLEAQSL
jgi:formylmethanofuran dehydrogenase subunit B